MEGENEGGVVMMLMEGEGNGGVAAAVVVEGEGGVVDVKGEGRWWVVVESESGERIVVVEV